jgi:hypothetical protein
MCFTVFVVDHGVVMVSRGQAQNAADAGALAGAVARAFDDPADPPETPIVASAATQVAFENLIFGAPGTVGVTFACPPGVDSRCVRVDVYRNGEAESAPLPAFFAPLLGIESQGVRATATARVTFGNATECMRPFAVADRWIEQAGNPERYNRWVSQGNDVIELNPHDIYAPPSADDPGTGFRLPDHLGAETTLKNGNPQNNNEPITPGWFLAVRLPDGSGGYTSGAASYRENIGRCVGQPVAIGDYLPTESGAMVGPTREGIEDLIALDPSAYWDADELRVRNSCAPECAPFSPRMVALAVFDIDEFQYNRAANNWSHCPTGGRCVRVVNILGFFVSHMEGNDVIGYLAMHPGQLTGGAPVVTEEASFLASVQLVR